MGSKTYAHTTFCLIYVMHRLRLALMHHNKTLAKVSNTKVNLAGLEIEPKLSSGLMVATINSFIMLQKIFKIQCGDEKLTENI